MIFSVRWKSTRGGALAICAVLLLSLLKPNAEAFTASSSAALKLRHSRATTSCFMVPKYDPMSGRWEPSDDEEGQDAGYPPVGSLIRQGPVPFIQRLKDPDMYDQAVLKMMATSDKPMSRDEAQGNMDAYFQNPNDWALQKFEEKNGAPAFDYANANMEGDSLILTGAWAGLLLGLVGRIVYVSAFGCDEFCRQYHW
eukprot:CAMPEP_0176025230 /NCGR_PEP_ID=MMETSP0120_2-20121206/12339_1 /TAXON_ID=160619 /ORGANISM="Kryptoperidinium foliaceum, Strain CCMP 1326" /LENGTH=196 /DNA_ID=CAMNT_0017358411 /DNA_START=44 /DNA_END=634 /DNA_ORIENTATION=-